MKSRQVRKNRVNVMQQQQEGREAQNVMLKRQNRNEKGAAIAGRE